MREARSHRYVIGMGSNMRVPGVGNPRAVLAAALEKMAGRGLRVLASSPVIETRPLGPSLRRYANAAALLEAPGDPADLLAVLQGIERDFGRRRRGQRWRARQLDLDILLWSGGVWAAPTLVIPHPRLRERQFALAPAAAVAPAWRDPWTGLTLAQLACRAA